MRALVLAFAVGLLGACDRSDAPSGRPSHTTGTAGTPGTPGSTDDEADGTAGGATPSLDPGSTEGRCVVPTAAEPPPQASPATVCPTDPGGAPDLQRGFVEFPEAPGRPRVAVELARSQSARTRGLMYRTSMPDDEGMLFTWSDERPRSFWMRNTCIPLDMMFIAADGFIVGLLEQVPVLDDTARSIPCPAKHVLETNAGWAREHGVVAGQRVVVDAP